MSGQAKLRAGHSTGAPPATFCPIVISIGQAIDGEAYATLRAPNAMFPFKDVMSATAAVDHACDIVAPNLKVIRNVISMNDQMRPVHFTRFPSASPWRMISTISPRVFGRKPVAAVKVTPTGPVGDFRSCPGGGVDWAGADHGFGHS